MGAWYTDAQADLGARTFGTNCNGCHGDSMIEIFANYDNAAKFFNFASGSMPAENPGSLDNSEYIAIIAYLMREMGFPAGDSALVANRELLAEIKPKDSHEALGFVVTTEQEDAAGVPAAGGQQ